MSDVAAARFDAVGFDRLDRFFMFNLKLVMKALDVAVLPRAKCQDFRRQPVSTGRRQRGRRR